MPGHQQFDPSVNFYAVLGVAPNATRDEVTRCYRDLMRVTHPDNFMVEEDRLKAEERARLINAAYTVLSRAESRREYDRVMRHQLMADVVMQRYTGGAYRTPPEYARRPPSASAIRDQRTAYRSAVWQLMLSTATVVAAIALVIVVAMLVFSGVRALV